MSEQNPYATNQPLEPQTEKVLAVVVHLAAIPFEFLAPLLGYLFLKDRGPFITHHVRESLNFSITVFLIGLVLAISIVGWLIIWLVPAYWVIMRIWAAVMASQGEFFKYPLTLRLLRG